MVAPPPIDPLAPRAERSGHLSALQSVILLLQLTAGIVLLILGFYLEERIRGQAAWRSYEREAKKRGVKLSFEEYIPPKIPDAENFASIPIFDAVFRASEKGLEISDPFKLPAPTKGLLPKFGDPIKQTPIDLAAWQAYFLETKLLAQAGDSASADILKALDHFAGPLAQLREAEKRPHCRFPIHWEKTWAAELPQYGLLQSGAKLNALRLSAHLGIGESAAAYEDFRDGLRLAIVFTDEPSLIAGLVRVSVISIMENAVWSGLARHQWAEAELRKIEADLAKIDCLKDNVFAMSCERGSENAMFDAVIRNPRTAGFLNMGSKSADNWLLLYPTGWLYDSKVRANCYIDEMLARIDPNQRRWFGERSVPSSPDGIQGQPAKFRQLLFMLVAPALEVVEKKYVQIATVTDEARLACALERFRLARGKFPNALTELSPEFLPTIPVEIVNGEPYHYRRTDDGSFVLYSIGTDLRDDGGVLDPKLSASKQADWVWRYPTK